MNTVHPLPPSVSYTPLQAVQSALTFAENDNLQDVLIIGYDADGDLVIRSSRMDRKDALWMIEKAREWVFQP